MFSSCRVRRIAMSYYVVSHKVDDFGEWKKVYDDFESVRQKYGVREQLLIQASDDPNHVLVVGQGDLDAIQKFVSSEELKEGMRDAGVSSEPNLFVGDEAG
jgi:hypothetical protein